ncbi:MAG: hypothetical protein R2861_03835 [Desulfobacterales bacterium]
MDTVIQTVKRISADLRPGLLDDLGLSAAVECRLKAIKSGAALTFM